MPNSQAFRIFHMHCVTHNGNAVIPSKIVCIGRNYVEHIKELGNEIPDQMVVFNKPNSALSDKLVAHRGEAIHYEGELAFLVAGGQPVAVAFGLDLTKRELQSQLKSVGLPWERAKSFDGAALFSEFVDIQGDINTLSLQLTVNASLRQKGGVELMTYKPLDIIAELASYTTLFDGDIVMTGTPGGAGVINHGDQFSGAVMQGEKSLVTANWLAC
jgi:2-keto-4-pentenoate hydratase/2-oxohepta-3-ene-1,7-dioic acid hydratase in catechol pathway